MPYNPEPVILVPQTSRALEAKVLLEIATECNCEKNQELFNRIVNIAYGDRYVFSDCVDAIVKIFNMVVERKTSGDITPSDFMEECMGNGAFDKIMGSLFGGSEPETPKEESAGDE